MTIQQIINANVTPATFIGLDTLTEVPLRGGRGNPMQGRITKRVTGSSVMIFRNRKSNAYENMVKRRLATEGKNPEQFVLSERTWGVRQPNTPFVEHNDNMYLEVIFLRHGVVEYLLDGNPIAKNAIIGLIEKEEARQGGLDNKVIIRTYSFESIRRIRIDHEEHVL